MTWTYRRRANPGSEVIADYECPIHGRFVATVPRGVDGDPPGTLPCNAFDGEDAMCCATSPWRASAPGAVRVQRAEVVRGKSAEHPSDRHVMDTRPLADGMPIEEFKARRAAVHRDESLRRVRGALGRTGRVWR